MDDDRRAEALSFGRYLAGSWPSETDLALYLQALETRPFDTTDRDRRTLDFVVRHPRVLGIIDGGLALRRPQSVVRQRLLLMAAILEASPAHAEQFLPMGRSPLYVFYVGFVGIRAAVRGVIGAVLVTWILSALPTFIVVGSGNTGAMAAQTLVEAGATVTMLDVGRTDATYAPLIPDADLHDDPHDRPGAAPLLAG